MSSGTPLDDLLTDFLNDYPSELSDKEIDAQLSASAEPKKPATGRRALPPTPPAFQKQLQLDPIGESTESAINAAFERMQVAEEDAESVDQAVKTASHGVRVLAPLLGAIARWIDPGQEPVRFESLMAQALNRVSRDSLLVTKAYGVAPAQTPPWLISQVSGQIMDLLIQAIDRNNGEILTDEDRSYLEPLLNQARASGGIAGSFYAQPSSPSLQLINALTLAASEVMSEFHAFTYFRGEASDTAEEITGFLHERVVQGTLDSMTERFSLNDNERAYFGGTLLRGAGRLLAEAWVSQKAATLELVKQLPKDERRAVLVSGYPLNAVFEEFEKAYQGLEISSASAIRALSPHRETQQSRRHAHRVA